MCINEYQSVDQLHTATDLPCLMNFLASVYERRTLVIATSNFSMLTNGGILQRIAQVDKVGRILSRCKELLSTAGEIYLPGHDYREDIAASRRDSAASRMMTLRPPASTD